MFQRSNSGPNGDKSRVTVNLVMRDGKKLFGQIYIPTTSQLANALNKDGNFIEFETSEGEILLLNKSEIHSVVPFDAPAANQLYRVKHDIAVFDPHSILGVDRNAGTEAIRIAYHALARNYHPDRFSSIDLPKEMKAYVNAMATRINLAYQQLSASNNNVPAVE